MDFNFGNFERLADAGFDDDDDDDDLCMVPTVRVAPGPPVPVLPRTTPKSNISTSNDGSTGAPGTTNGGDRKWGDVAPGAQTGRGRGRLRNTGQQQQHAGTDQLSSGGPQNPWTRKSGRSDRLKQADLESLNMAIRLGRLEVVESLLSEGPGAGDGRIPVDTPMPGGWSPLMCAASSALPEMVALILRFEPNVNYDCGKKTALMVACDTSSSQETGVQESVKVLIESGAKANIRDSHGMSPLMMAARKGRLAVCRMLLQHGASVCLADLTGTTALMWAAQEGQLAIVRVLVLAGAELNQENNASETAESMAYAAEHTPVCDYLEQVRNERRHQPLDHVSDDDGGSAKANRSKSAVGQLEIFLDGLRLGHLIELFKENNISFAQLATISEDDLAKMGVVDGQARHVIAEGARRLANPSEQASAGRESARAMHRHQIRLDDVCQILRNLNRHLKFQREAAEYLLTELQRQPLNINLIQERDLNDLVKKSSGLQEATQTLFDTADDTLACADMLVNEGDDEDGGQGTSFLQSRSFRAAALSIPVAAAVAAGACVYASRTGLISWA
ncbi:ankyrin repeat, SAM and basic leucine zipper domain-containing protein 1-like [Sycon ciliatum]|uniref:ankyrin repeat, SAM and basic leucine zipper domain-containing protein 1-like n=1 Tax=Sycon ciliatum TaxID=27933 RepID=UPI0031F6E1A8